MERELASFRLKQIENTWNNFILEFKACNSKIKYTDDVKSNYLGEILVYFILIYNIVIKYNRMKMAEGWYDSNYSIYLLT